MPIQARHVYQILHHLRSVPDVASVSFVSSQVRPRIRAFLSPYSFPISLTAVVDAHHVDQDGHGLIWILADLLVELRPEGNVDFALEPIGDAVRAPPARPVAQVAAVSQAFDDAESIEVALGRVEFGDDPFCCDRLRAGL